MTTENDPDNARDPHRAEPNPPSRVWWAGARSARWSHPTDVAFAQAAAPPATLTAAAFSADGKQVAVGASIGNIGDARMDSIAQLRELDRLEMTGTSVTGAGLAKIAGLTKLRRLAVGSVAPLASLKLLIYLDLPNSPRVTGAGLEPLRGLSELRSLVLVECPVEDETLAKLPDWHRGRPGAVGEAQAARPAHANGRQTVASRHRQAPRNPARLQRAE